MNKEDDDTLEDVNSLMKMIGGKKKDAPPRPTAAEKDVSRSRCPGIRCRGFLGTDEETGHGKQAGASTCTGCATGHGTPPPLNNTPGSHGQSLF